MYAIIIVRIVTRLRAEKPRETGLNTDGGKRFFLSPNAHTGSGMCILMCINLNIKFYTSSDYFRSHKHIYFLFQEGKCEYANRVILRRFRLTVFAVEKQ